MATRALVLGGGGLVGIAWEAGLLAGLSESGVDLARADFIVGTSAGSFVGAQVAMGRSASSIVDGILAEDPARSFSIGGRPMKVPDMSVLLAKMAEAVSGARPAEQVRAEIGAWALSAETRMSEKKFIAGFGRSFSGLPEDFWPDRPYACTAVDAADGSFVLWNKDSKVGLVDAVASSCAAPGVFPPITIRGRRYIDGGMRSPTNADAAKGYDVVAVVEVRGAGIDAAMAERFQSALDRELDALRSGGARVELIVPDPACVEAFGLNPMDPSRRKGAATAGVAQGKASADRLREFWNGR
jgi:NTE family protein